MARRARFGRLPRSAPSLTATIVALSQEYMRVRDNNIEDAWKNGGQFEGHKVTDDEMLSYWTKRRNSVSKDDPMWDYYNNQLHAFQFNIEETKAYLKYKQHKIGEGAMAAFYAHWAKKMPVNSANYRMLMTKAAEFRDSAARGRSSSDYAAREARYQKNQTATWDKFERPWDAFQQSVMRYMRENDYVDTNAITESNNGGWAAFHDPAILNAVLWNLNNNPDYADGKKALVAAMNDPNFSGNFTEADLDRLTRRKQQGLKQRITRAVKSGNHDADVTKLKRDQSITDAATVAIGTAGMQDVVDRMGRELNEVLADPTATPDEVSAKIKEVHDWINTEGRRMVEDELPSGFDPLSGKPANEYAVDLMGRLNGTVATLEGKPTGLSMWDDPYGNETLDGKPGLNTMAGKIAEQVNIVLPQAEALAGGKAVLVAIGENKDPVSGPHGSGWAVYEVGDPRLSNRDIFIMPNAKGIAQAFKGAPITVEAYKGMDPNTREPVGDKVQLNRDEVQGFTVDFDSGGGTTTKMYGVYVDGELRWSHVSPIPATDTSKVDVDPVTGGLIVKGISGNAKPNVDNWIDRDGLMTTKQGVMGGTYVIGSKGTLLQAAMRASDADATRIANMDDNTYRTMEADYLTIHPTKAMQNAKAQAGDQGFQAAMNEELRMSTNTKQEVRFYGPDSQRDRVISAMQGQAQAATDERLRRQALDDAGLRQSLVADVTAWQADHANTPYSGKGIVAGWGLEGQYKKQPSLSDIPGASGWTLNALLSSPQISTLHAKEIAAYLTSGGVAGGPATTTIPGQTGEVPRTDFNNPEWWGEKMFRALSPRIDAAMGPDRKTTVTTPTQVINNPAPRVPSAVPTPTAAAPIQPEQTPQQAGVMPTPTVSVGLNTGQTRKRPGGGFYE